jgi:hypothetical protein
MSCSVRSTAVLRPNIDQRKSEILEAAAQVIIDVGFTEMTVADLAEAADVSTATWDETRRLPTEHEIEVVHRVSAEGYAPEAFGDELRGGICNELGL